MKSGLKVICLNNLVCLTVLSFSMASCGQSVGSSLSGGQGSVARAQGNALDFIAEFTAAPHALVLGDSMAAGALSDTVIGQSLTTGQTNRLSQALTLHLKYDPDSKEYRENLQELSVQKNATAFESHAKWSLVSQLGQRFPRAARPLLHNESIIGTTAETLFEQIAHYRKRYAAGVSPAELVVLNVGGNDWCSPDSSPAEYLHTMEFRLYQILKDHPRSVVLVNGLANLPAIFELRTELAFSVGERKLQCMELADYVEEQCPQGAKLRAATDPAEARALASGLQQKALAMNRGLKEIVERLRRGAGSYDVYAGRLVFVDLDSMAFDKRLLSADCFHPGSFGHEQWAKLMWQKLSEY